MACAVVACCPSHSVLNQKWCSDAQDMSEQHVESLFRDLDLNGTGAIEIEDFELAILGRVGALGHHSHGRVGLS